MDILTAVADKDRLDFSQNFNIVRNYDGDREFPDIKTQYLEAEYLRLSDALQLPTAAMVHAFDTEAHLGKRPTAEKVTIEKLLIKEKINQSERVQLLKDKGVTGTESLLQYIFNDAGRLAENVKTRTEVAKMEVLATGKMTVQENNLNFAVEYGVSKDNHFTLDWDDPDHDILGDIQLQIAGRAIGSIFIPALEMILPPAIAVVEVVGDMASELASLVGFKMAEAFSKDRLSPMIRDTPVLSKRVNERSRDSGNTIMQKKFAGGHVTLVGANSPASIASRPIRIVLADEIDRFPATAGNEGDPLLLMEARTNTFWNKKKISVSTPTIEGLSRIEVEYENSTQGEWQVPCPECGAMQPLEWGKIVFDKEDLDHSIGHMCEKCGAVSSENEWKCQQKHGKFIEKHPNRKVKGFHLNALASPWKPWREIVEELLKAKVEVKKGNIELMKVWVNTELGETWQETGEEMEPDALLKRREWYHCEVPQKVVVLTAGVDVQDDRLECEVVGWGVDKESFGIQYSKFYGTPEQEDVWNRLDSFLSRVFTRADTAIMYILTNEKYIGDSLLQKSFTTDTLPFRKVRNTGQKDRYYVTGSHEPIISKVEFEQVKQLLELRRQQNPNKGCTQQYNLSLKIYCGKCGATFRRRVTNEKVYWVYLTGRHHSKNCGENHSGNGDNGSILSTAF
nr:terminase gpA endonuclease subunit [uncultured Caproiciproducens sp.]